MKHFYALTCIILATLTGKAQTNTDWYDKGQTSFTITTAQELAGLAKLVNDGTNFEDKTITLGSDISLTDWLADNDDNNKGWKPIGREYDNDWKDDRSFNGTFDGNGYSISGLWLNRTNSEGTKYPYAGLFGYIDKEGEIKNLRVVIDNSPGKNGLQSRYPAGGLAGYNDGTITGCSVVQSGEADIPAISSRQTVGGLVSENTGSIRNSYAGVYVQYASQGQGEDEIGGLAGRNEGRIENCYATGKVAEQSDEDDNRMGGLAGYNEGDIFFCYAIGVVHADDHSDDTEVGGLVGYARNDHSTITASFFNQTNNVSLGITGNSRNNGTITASSGQPTSNMKTIDLYTDEALDPNAWDFETTWGIDNTAAINNGYPFLRWQAGFITLTITEDDNFTYTVAGSTATTDANSFPIPIGGSFSFAVIPADGYTAEDAEVKAGTVTLTGDVSGVYTLNPIYCDSVVTVTGIRAVDEPGDDKPTPFQHAITLIADDGLILLPSEGTHGVEPGNSFTFYITMDEGFEGHAPQVTVNEEPVEAVLRPNGTEWMYTIPNVYDDTRVAITFATTGIDPVSAAHFYSRDRQLFVETPQPLTLTVYTVTGQQIVNRRLIEGLTTIPLPPGIYILQMNNTTGKIVIK